MNGCCLRLVERVSRVGASRGGDSGEEVSGMKMISAVVGMGVDRVTGMEGWMVEVIEVGGGEVISEVGGVGGM